MPRPSNLLAGVASQQHAEAPANEVPGQARDDVKDEPTRVTGVLVRPVTGVLVHPVTGVLVRPVTGVLVHPVTGVLVHPVTGVLAHPVIPANAGISNTSRRPATESGSSPGRPARTAQPRRSTAMSTSSAAIRSDAAVRSLARSTAS